jgi:hypothetical protein
MSPPCKRVCDASRVLRVIEIKCNSARQIRNGLGSNGPMRGFGTIAA